MRPLALAAVLLGLAQITAAEATHGRQMLEDGVTASIVNGTDAARRFPWMVTLRMFHDVNEHFCGASLIAPRIVMTAAHCPLPRRFDDLKWHPWALIGAYSKTGDAPDSYETRRVIATLVHPKYDPFSHENDISLMLLDKPSTKAPVKLPGYRQKPTLPAAPGTKLTALGWGYWLRNDSSPGEYPDLLQQVTMPLLPLDKCTRAMAKYARLPTNFSSPTNRMICAGTPPKWGVGTCQDDSGGPLILESAGGKEGNDVQMGIVSWGEGSCLKSPGVFTNVAQLRRWIAKSSAELQAGKWTGRVYGALQVSGFRGQTSVVKGQPGDKVDILIAESSKDKFRFWGKLNQGASQGSIALGSLVFVWHDSLQVVLQDGMMLAFLNGDTLQATGSWQPTPSGASVFFNNPQAGSERYVILRQPGMAIRISQAFSAGSNTYSPWLDVQVTIRRLFSYPLSGVLGDTFLTAYRGA